MTKFKMLALESELVKNNFTSLVKEIRHYWICYCLANRLNFFGSFFFQTFKAGFRFLFVHNIVLQSLFTLKLNLPICVCEESIPCWNHISFFFFFI
jgi:hypothetical protein